MLDFFFTSYLGLILFFSTPLCCVIVFLLWEDSRKAEKEKQESKEELEARVKQLEEKLREKDQQGGS